MSVFYPFLISILLTTASFCFRRRRRFSDKYSSIEDTASVSATIDADFSKLKPLTIHFMTEYS